MSNYTCLAGYQKRRKVFGDDAASSGGSFLSSVVSRAKSVFGAGGRETLVFYDNLSITLLQKALMARGYDVGTTGTDGKWGKHTQAAVAKFLVDQGEPNYPAIPDYHVLSDLGISPNNDMMSTATTRTSPPPAAPSGSGGPPVANHPSTNKPPTAVEITAGNVSTSTDTGLEPWQLGVVVGLGGLGLILLIAAIAKGHHVNAA